MALHGSFQACVRLCVHCSQERRERVRGHSICAVHLFALRLIFLDIEYPRVLSSRRAGSPTEGGSSPVFCHLVLGFLRDGRPRHGYELLTEHRSLLGERINPGSLYRELGRLSAQGLVQTGANPPAADPRRIPYQITEGGREVFDRWLASASGQDGDFPAWLVFIDRVPPDVRSRVLARREETLWIQSKTLARDRSDALADLATAGKQYHPLPVLLSRRMKLVAAEVEFLTEFRELLDHISGVERAPVVVSAPAAARARALGRRRTKTATK
jgi:DNA-binding PadR family transcriptional regulator